MFDTVITDHITKRVSWVSVEDFLKNIAPRCVDGREGTAIAGTPGGEAGEFLIMLSAVERLSGSQMTSEEVTGAFGAYLEWSGHFYMHSDRHMLERIEKVLLESDVFKVYFEGVSHARLLSEIENFVRMPPSKAQDALLEVLIGTLNLGCGHIYLMRSKEDEYGVRSELINAFLAAFYRALWRGERIDWEVLAGDHEERAVVNVLVTSEGVVDKIPLVVPNCFGSQVFVNHPQAFEIVMEHLFAFVQTYFNYVDRVPYFAEVEVLAARHMSATLGHLAQGLPIFTIYVSEDGGSSVEQVGVV
jgi:hypothetical protein